MIDIPTVEIYFIIETYNALLLERLKESLEWGEKYARNTSK